MLKEKIRTQDINKIEKKRISFNDIKKGIIKRKLNKMMSFFLHYLALWALFVKCIYAIVLPRDGLPGTQKSAPTSLQNRNRWGEAAYNHLQGWNCSAEPYFTSVPECRKILQVPKSQVNFYLAEPKSYGKYRAYLPDRVLDKGRLHSGVMVLDPYPTASFGHLVLVFFIDQDVSFAHCQHSNGFSSDRDCLTLAIRKRCRNHLGPKSVHSDLARRCEISFIPTVFWFVLDERHPHESGKKQKLKCHSDVIGYATCPSFPSEEETAKLICNPLEINTKRCDITQDQTETQCRPMEICDQAVLITGGWNRFTLHPRHKTNLRNMYHMLRQNGFHSRNIEVFYANGSPDVIPEKTKQGHLVYPAAMKLALRNHIRSLCTTAKCVDTLVIYMNSPMKNEGSTLLWDINGNGLAEDNERYKLGELKKDLKHCTAETVFLIVDQSHAGRIADAISGSQDHQNVQVLASSLAHEYSFGSNFTDFISSYNHSHTCLSNVLEESRSVLTKSVPQVSEGWGWAHRMRKNIFGAPCNLAMPFRSWELDTYRGCRSVPTSVWLKVLRESRLFEH